MNSRRQTAIQRLTSIQDKLLKKPPKPSDTLPTNPSVVDCEVESTLLLSQTDHARQIAEVWDWVKERLKSCHAEKVTDLPTEVLEELIGKIEAL